MNYYGWRIAWALAVSTTFSYGVLYYAFSVVVQPMEAELGWSRAQTSLGFSLAIVVGGLVAIPMGRWVDRNGARSLMTLGSLLGSLLVWGWANVQGLAVFYLLFALMGLAMGAVFYEVAFTVVAVWFRRNRARATLLVTLVAGFASTIFIPLTTVLVERLGWRGALEVLSVVLALSTVPLHFLILRRRPSDLGLWPDGEALQINPQQLEHHTDFRSATRQPRFWWLTLAFALQALIAVGLAAHMVPLLSEKGHSAGVVAAAAGSVGVMQVVGRLMFVPVGPKWTQAQGSMAVFALRIAAMLVLLLLPAHPVGLWLFVFLYGTSNGMVTLARAGIIAELFGSAHYGSISGAMFSAMGLAQALAPFLAGVLHTVSDNYSLTIWLWLGAAVLALGALGQTGLSRGEKDSRAAGERRGRGEKD